MDTTITQNAWEVRRDPAFARRLEQACDASFLCPPVKRGRLVWLQDQLNDRFKIDVSLETVRRWVEGISKPRRDKNDRIAEILGVDPVWLYLGVDSRLTPREQKIRNAEADGAVNVVAGLIQMDGGHPAFPESGDPRAKEEHIDLYAVIRGAQYAFHVSLGEAVDGGYRFGVPLQRETLVVLGLIRDGFNFTIVELTPEVVGSHGKSGFTASAMVTLDAEQIEANRVKGFSTRL